MVKCTWFQLENREIIPVIACVKVRFLLFLSARHGQLKCVRLLLERGAKVVPDNEGVSPLELCAQVTAPVATSARMVLPLSYCSPSLSSSSPLVPPEWLPWVCGGNADTLPWWGRPARPTGLHWKDSRGEGALPHGVSLQCLHLSSCSGFEKA